MTENRPIIERVIVAERRLLDPEVRTDRAQLETLLDENFTEIGQSGRLWSRSEILDALVTASPIGEFELAEPDVREVGEDLYLLTYRLRTSAGLTIRSSLWRVHVAGERILFHQGTPVGD